MYNNDGYHRDVNLETILAPWFDAKSEYLFNLFEGKLILSKKICFEKTYEDLIDKMRSSNFARMAFVHDFREKVMYNVAFHCARDENSYKPEWDLEYMISYESLAKNKYSGTDIELISPITGEIFKIVNGCKTIKALGKIAKEFGIDSFEEFRIAHSMILNDKKVSGNLCLSIHPNDYATMSDNNYGWNSCMSWEDNGGYCQGTVEMMNSPMVIVAYLEGEDDNFYFGNRHWSNKKWRELFVVDRDVIIEIAAYPYENSSITNQVLDWLRELAVKNLNWKQFEDVERETLHSDDGRCYTEDKKFYIDFYSNAMYNDFRFNHNCFISKEIVRNPPLSICIEYSGLSECLSCGATSNSWSSLFDHEGSLACIDCISYNYCDCCGDRIHGEVYWVDGHPTCYYCYENSKYCENCEENYFADDFEELYIGNKEERWYNKHLAIKVCSDCWRKLKERYLKPGAEINYLLHNWTTTSYINIYDLTAEAIEFIDYRFKTPEELEAYYRKELPYGFKSFD